jgi:hypothetical protein
MKPLKILAFLCIMLGLLSNAVNAQPAQKGQETWTTCWPLDCVGELACGDITHTWLSNGNIFKESYIGTLIGQETGTFYKIKQTYSTLIVGNKSYVFTNPVTIMVHANGKLIAFLHFLSHVTINANGETTVWIGADWTVECK